MGATCLALVLVPMKSVVNSGKSGRSCWGDHTEPSPSLPEGRPGTALLKLILPKPVCKKKKAKRQQICPTFLTSVFPVLLTPRTRELGHTGPSAELLPAS